MVGAGEGGVLPVPEPADNEGMRRSTPTGLRSEEGLSGEMLGFVHLSVGVAEEIPVFVRRLGNGESVTGPDEERIIDRRLSDLDVAEGIFSLPVEPPKKSANSCTDVCLALCVFLV